MEAPSEQSTSIVNDTSPSRLTKLKLAFLYVLIGGLAAAAITAVIALLIGHFNTAIVKSLLTILVFFSHSLLILAILWADRHNQVGKLLLPTSIVVLVFANMITTTLGTWEIISAETAWRFLGLYFLIVGAVFTIIGTLRLRVAQQAVRTGIYVTTGLTAATVIALAPWILKVVPTFDPLYYRIVAALAILASTGFLISLVLRGIAVGRDHLLRDTAPKSSPIPAGLLAIYIVTGVITAMVWTAGLTGFIVSGVQSASGYSSSSYSNSPRYY